MHYPSCRRSIRTPSKLDWARFVIRFPKPNGARPTPIIRLGCGGERRYARSSLAANLVTSRMAAPVRPLTYFALRQILERVNVRLGTNITWHDLRHTFTHRLLSDKSVGVSDVQQLLRHRDLNTLSSYSATRVDELAQRLQAVYSAPKPAAFAGEGYNDGDLQTLFPRVCLPPAEEVE